MSFTEKRKAFNEKYLGPDYWGLKIATIGYVVSAISFLLLWCFDWKFCKPLFVLGICIGFFGFFVNIFIQLSKFMEKHSNKS